MSVEGHPEQPVPSAISSSSLPYSSQVSNVSSSFVHYKDFDFLPKDTRHFKDEHYSTDNTVESHQSHGTPQDDFNNATFMGHDYYVDEPQLLMEEPCSIETSGNSEHNTAYDFRSAVENIRQKQLDPVQVQDLVGQRLAQLRAKYHIPVDDTPSFLDEIDQSIEKSWAQRKPLTILTPQRNIQENESLMLKTSETDEDSTAPCSPTLSSTSQSFLELPKNASVVSESIESNSTLRSARYVRPKRSRFTESNVSAESTGFQVLEKKPISVFTRVSSRPQAESRVSSHPQAESSAIQTTSSTTLAEASRQRMQQRLEYLQQLRNKHRPAGSANSIFAEDQSTEQHAVTASTQVGVHDPELQTNNLFTYKHSTNLPSDTMYTALDNNGVALQNGENGRRGAAKVSRFMRVKRTREEHENGEESLRAPIESTIDVQGEPQHRMIPDMPVGGSSYRPKFMDIQVFEEQESDMCNENTGFVREFDEGECNRKSVSQQDCDLQSLSVAENVIPETVDERPATDSTKVSIGASESGVIGGRSNTHVTQKGPVSTNAVEPDMMCVEVKNESNNNNISKDNFSKKPAVVSGRRKTKSKSSHQEDPVISPKSKTKPSQQEDPVNSPKSKTKPSQQEDPVNSPKSKTKPSQQEEPVTSPKSKTKPSQQENPVNSPKSKTKSSQQGDPVNSPERKTDNISVTSTGDETNLTDQGQVNLPQVKVNQSNVNCRDLMSPSRSGNTIFDSRLKSENSGLNGSIKSHSPEKKSSNTTSASNLTNTTPASNLTNTTPASNLTNTTPASNLTNTTSASNLTNTTPASNLTNTTPASNLTNESNEKIDSENIESLEQLREKKGSIRNLISKFSFS